MRTRLLPRRSVARNARVRRGPDRTMRTAARWRRSTHGYRWLPPFGVAIVRCAGTCVVAAQSSGPPRANSRAVRRVQRRAAVLRLPPLGSPSRTCRPRRRVYAIQRPVRQTLDRVCRENGARSRCDRFDRQRLDRSRARADRASRRRSRRVACVQFAFMALADTRPHRWRGSARAYASGEAMSSRTRVVIVTYNAGDVRRCVDRFGAGSDGRVRGRRRR